jgi:peptidoglycan/LPS O-acetylase OafA/YrhL
MPRLFTAGDARPLPTQAQPVTRRNDLDALRATVMVLGIALHAALPFFSAIWPVPEPTASPDGWFDEFVQAVHGFRMHVFFVLSGYFTALLLRRHGLGPMLTHRGRRVLLPLLIGAVTIVPLVDLASSGAAAPLAAGQMPEPGLGTPTHTEWFTANQTLHHLWFLWFLIIYVAVLALCVRAVECVRGPRATPLRIPWAAQALAVIALIGVTVLTQVEMVGTGPERNFGPMLSNIVRPDLTPLLFYGAFFAFGALLHAGRTRTGEPLVAVLGARWPVYLTLGLVVLFPIALAATWDDLEGPRLLAGATQAAYSWVMVVGLIGLFRRVLSKPRRGVRYLADASYWMYLMHLPVLIATHRVINNWDLAAFPKFALLCVVVTAVLLVSYQACVRHTAIGRLLNGPVAATVPQPRAEGRVLQVR